MKLSVLSRLALRSMAARKTIYFPFLLAVTLLFSLEYVLLSLLQNNYVQEFHADLSLILGIGIFFSTVLIIIITLYTSHFIQSNMIKEHGLYSVLGLEKKHIRRIIGIQNGLSWLVTSIFSVILGYLLGNIIFVALNRLMQDTGASFMDYPFQIEAALGVVALLLLSFFVIYVMNAIKISRLNPINLLTSTHEGDGEPKGRWWLAILGLISLGAGYYIALTTDNVLSSLTNIFIAIFFVVVGTYFLFLSLSILVLKMMKRNKKSYYKPNHFLSVSGMLHRMNNNAVSLSSIAILCSGVILVLGLTVSLYRSMEEQINAITPAEYTIEPASLESYQNPPAENEEFLSGLVEDLSEYGEIENVRTQTNLSVGAYLSNNSLEQLPTPGSAEAEALDSSGQPVYIFAETVETYNELNNTSETLEENEVLLTSNLLNTDELSTIEIAGRTYDTKIVPSDAIPANIGIEAIYLGVSSQEQLNAIQEEFQTYNPTTEEYFEPSFDTSIYFDVAGDETAVRNRMSELANAYELNVETVEETRNSTYSLYGGLLFIGTVVSVVLIIGTILMLHFKQISEGYEDRNKYNIMQKVGLPDSLIRKTIRSQIIWIFLLPILVAIIHNIFASNIMYTMVGLLGMSDPTIFITSYFGVIIVFALVYLVFYWLTSKTYYTIINEN